MFLDRFEWFFYLTWKFDGESKSDIVLYPKLLTGPQNSKFLFRTDLNNYFFLTLKFDRDSKYNIVLYLTWLSEPQNFVIIICCKINICSKSILVNIRLIIWYLNFVFMNGVILVIYKYIFKGFYLASIHCEGSNSYLI